MIWPDPVVSARKMSWFGATFRKRGLLNPVANTFTRNPAGTVGRNPSGGLTRSGPLPADFVANGAGSFGFCPCVTCAGKQAARNKLATQQKTVFDRIREPLAISICRALVLLPL